MQIKVEKLSGMLSFLAVKPVSLDVLRESAMIRATTKNKMPDAIHLSTALQSGCTHFVSNDKGIAGVENLATLSLDDF